MDSLKDKTVRGVGWTALDSVASYGISFLVGLVLARLLSPDEYGLIGIITIFIAVFNTIIDSGFSIALIRKPNVTNDDYCTVFFINLGISVVLALLLYFGANGIANYFGREELVSLTQVMSCILIINALGIVQKAKLTKQLDFKSQTKVSIIASSISGVLGIGTAILGMGVWALVVQQVSRQLLNTFLLWTFSRWIPQLRLSLASFKELFGFSWKLLVAQIINTVWAKLYQFVIGKYYSSETLGHYTRAEQFATIFSSNITTIVQRVSLPVMSEIQDNTQRLVAAYRRIIKSTMLLTLVLMFGLAAVAKPMIYVLIGEQWMPCVPFLQILCFSFAFYPLHALNLNMLQVQGRSDILLILQIVKNIIALIPLALGIWVGIYWMLGGSVICGFFDYFVNSYYSGKKLGYTSWQQLKDIGPSSLVASIMAIPVWALSLLPISDYLILPVQLLCGTLIVVGLCETMRLEEYEDLKTTLTTYMSRIKK